jgi:hypothetical protein
MAALALGLGLPLVVDAIVLFDVRPAAGSGTGHALLPMFWVKLLFPGLLVGLTGFLAVTQPAGAARRGPWAR